jgi:RNA polymerase sigma-70 factor, ECF subfamily
MWDRVRMAWAMLSGRADRDVQPGRPREPAAAFVGEAPAIEADGFAEEALPWLDAVYRFSLRLTRGDRDAAEDLVQETFLRAHRFWHTYQRGTNAKSWLFTICRNAYLHQKNLVRSRREQPAADLDARVEALSAASAFEKPSPDPEQEFFGRLIDDQVVDAIDALPDEFREVLVLSDLGDLTYAEIAEVLDIPVGTVKSRLFRARNLLQGRLREFAVEAGYVQEAT